MLRKQNLLWTPYVDLDFLYGYIGLLVGSRGTMLPLCAADTPGDAQHFVDEIVRDRQKYIPGPQPAIGFPFEYNVSNKEYVLLLNIRTGGIAELKKETEQEQARILARRTAAYDAFMLVINKE